VNWRDDLSRVTLGDGRRLVGASFRGAPFLVEASDRSGGRRLAVHEFPFRSEPYVEDVGRRSRSFRVEAYVLGDDYIAQRDALLEALEDAEGPGELVHPYHGTRAAACDSFTVRESSAEGRMARIAIEFVEAPAQTLTPTEAPDLSALVDDGADAALAASSIEVAASYDVEDLPSFAIASCSAYLSAVADDLEAALAPLTIATAELALLKFELDYLRTQAVSLARDPVEAVTAFVTTLAAVGASVENQPAAYLEALLDVYDDAVMTLATATTATRERERANQEALMGAIRRLFVVEAARYATLATFATLDEALAVRGKILDRLDEQLGEAGDDAYPALVDLRARLVDAVPGDSELARLVTLEQPVAIPSILLTYRLYGDTAQELALVARNNAQHPGFLSGSLQVLSDV
jgi:prophage DNA circulation protein